MRQRGSGHRLATILFTDIVGSSRIAAELGDRRWRVLLDRHHAVVRKLLKRHGGHELDTAGDGFFATFAEPSDAIRCACEISDGVRELGIELRVGLNMGEAEVIGAKLGGTAVHAAARIMALAGPGEVLVASTIADMVPGSGFTFADRGTHALRDVPGSWHLYAIAGVDGQMRDGPLEPAAVSARLAAIQPAPLMKRRSSRVVAGIASVALIAVAIVIPLATRPPPPPKPLTIYPNSLVRIDPVTKRVLQVIRVGNGLDAGQIAMAAGKIWGLQGDGQDGNVLWIADPSTGRVTTYPGTLYSFGLVSGDDAVWVAGPGRSVSRLDPVSFPSTQAATVKIPVPGHPGLLAFGDGTVWAFDDAQRVAFGFDTSTASPEKPAKLSGAGAHPRNHVACRRPVSKGGVDVCVPPSGVAVGEGFVWVADYFGDGLHRVDTDASSSRWIPLAQRPPAGLGPEEIAVGFGDLWVSNLASGTVSTIDPATGEVIGAIQVGLGSSTVVGGIAIDPAGNGSVWVASPTDRTLVQIDRVTHKIQQKMTLPFSPAELLYADGSLWVTLSSQT